MLCFWLQRNWTSCDLFEFPPRAQPARSAKKGSNKSRYSGAMQRVRGQPEEESAWLATKRVSVDAMELARSPCRKLQRQKSAPTTRPSRRGRWEEGRYGHAALPCTLCRFEPPSFADVVQIERANCAPHERKGRVRDVCRVSGVQRALRSMQRAKGRLARSARLDRAPKTATRAKTNARVTLDTELKLAMRANASARCDPASAFRPLRAPCERTICARRRCRRAAPRNSSALVLTHILRFYTVRTNLRGATPRGSALAGAASSPACKRGLKHTHALSPDGPCWFRFRSHFCPRCTRISPPSLLFVVRLMHHHCALAPCMETELTTCRRRELRVCFCGDDSSNRSSVLFRQGSRCTFALYGRLAEKFDFALWTCSAGLLSPSGGGV